MQKKGLRRLLHIGVENIDLQYRVHCFDPFDVSVRGIKVNLFFFLLGAFVFAEEREDFFERDRELRFSRYIVCEKKR